MATLTNSQPNCQNLLCHLHCSLHLSAFNEPLPPRALVRIEYERCQEPRASMWSGTGTPWPGEPQRGVEVRPNDSEEQIVRPRATSHQTRDCSTARPPSPPDKLAQSRRRVLWPAQSTMTEAISSCAPPGGSAGKWVSPMGERVGLASTRSQPTI